MAHLFYRGLANDLIALLSHLHPDQQPEPAALRIGGAPDGTSSGFVELHFATPEQAQIVRDLYTAEGWQVTQHSATAITSGNPRCVIVHLHGE